MFAGSLTRNRNTLHYKSRFSSAHQYERRSNDGGRKREENLLFPPLYLARQPKWSWENRCVASVGFGRNYIDRRENMIAALYVITDGPYFGLEGIDPYDLVRDARKYRGPFPVIAHPPCERWGRYWSGGPSAHGTRLKGDDSGCFAHALWAVRAFGGVVEHPEASHAFHFYGLPIPAWHGGWSEPDKYGGRSACMAQGHYGHPARKMTWLYAIGIDFSIPIPWGPSTGGLRRDEGFHSKEHRARAIKTGVCQRLSARQRKVTPEPFKELLIQLVRSVKS